MSDAAEVFLGTFRALPETDQKEVVNRLLQAPEASVLVGSSVLINMVQERVEDREPNVQSPESVPPRHTTIGRLTYDRPGRLSGPIHGRQVSVLQLPHRRFPKGTTIDGVEHRQLSMEYVENELRIAVNRKADGSNSETVSRAVWRHLTDRYNMGDETVTYEPLN